MIKTEIILLTNNCVLPFQQLQKNYHLDFIELNKLFAQKSLAEHGLGFLINIYDMDNLDDKWGPKLKRKIIFDTGGPNLTYLYNLDIRSYNIYDVDTIILSHWHYDHTGGLNEILKRIEKKITIICHNDAKFERFFKRSDGVKNSDLEGKNRKEILPLLSSSKIVNQESVDLEMIKNLGGNMFFSKNPYEIFKNDELKITLSGEIPRKYEDEDFKNYFSLQDGILKLDKILDDKCLIFEYKNSVVLLTGCCHSGIMNTIDYVKSRINKEITHIIGGFHMENASLERIKSTIRYFKIFQDSYKPLYLFPIHCTGEKFVEQVNNSRIPNTKAFNCSVGTVFNIKTNGF